MYIKKFTKDSRTPYYPNLSLGWDNNVRFNNYMPGVVTGNTPDKIRDACIKLKEITDDALENSKLRVPLITVNSWNEWTETSYLQPDDLYGYGYLEAIQDVFC